MKYKEFLESKRKTFIESYFALNAKNHKECIEEKNSVLTLF